MIDLSERLELLRKALGDFEPWKDGLNFSFKCPNCKSSSEKKKLVLKIDSEEWHCWVCELKGRSILSLLRKYSSYSNEWRERFTSERRSIFEDDIKPQEVQIELPDCQTIESLLGSLDPDAKAILKYLESRNVDLDKSYRYRLCGSLRGKTRRRVIFPSFDSNGDLNYWTARAVGKSNIKYLNPKIERSNIVFNEIDIDWNQELTIVEGPFDLLNAGDNATTILGSSLSKGSLLLQRIVSMSTPVLLALDSDMKKKSHNIAKILYGYGIRVRIADLGNNKDLGEMSKDEFFSISSNAKEWNPNDRLSFLINTISSGSIL